MNFENLVPISRFTCRFSWVVFIFCIFTASQSTHASVESVSATSLALTQEEKDWLAAARPINVVTRHGWAPIEFISEGGEYRGISIDYLRKIESMLGIRFQLSASNLLTSEDTDVISATHAISAIKESGFQILNPPYVDKTFVIYSQKEGVHYKTLSDLKGKKVAAFKTGVISKLLANEHPDIQLYPADIAEEALEALLTGKVDAYVANPVVVNYVAQLQGMANIVISGTTPYKADLHMAVRQDWPLLISAMSKAMAAINEEERAEIMAGWQPVSYQYDLNLPLIISILLSSAAMLILFGRWNRRLKREISERINIEKSLLNAKENAEKAEHTIRSHAREIERLALVARKTLNAVIITDGDGFTTWVNPAFTANTGFTFEDILGKKPGELLQGPDTSKESIEYMRHSIRNHMDCQLELINYKKNGDKFWVNLSIAAIHNSMGDDVFIAVQNDITRQKDFIEYIENQRADMNAMFSLNPDGIVLIDQNRIVIQVNQAFSHMTQLQAESLIGLDLEALDFLLQQRCQNPEHYQSMCSEISTLSSIDAHDFMPLSHLIEIDREPTVIIERSFVPASETRIKGVFYFRDITQESMLKRMKTEFITTAAHELRTPMSVIHGYAELLNHKKHPDEVQNEMLQSILQKSNSVVDLLNDLLDIAKIEDRTTKELERQHQPITPLLQTIADTFITSKNQNRVLLEIVDPLPSLSFDAQKLERAINNCLSNAYKFSRYDSLVRMKADYIHNSLLNEVSISIIDHGIGMKPEQLARVFEKFYRADQSGHIPGTGLGMVLVKEIIEAHGGWVEVQSVYSAGTTVTLHLPVVEQSDDEQISH